MEKEQAVEISRREIRVNALQGGLPTDEKDNDGRPKLTELKPIRVNAIEIRFSNGSTFVT